MIGSPATLQRARWATMRLGSLRLTPLRRRRNLARKSGRRRRSTGKDRAMARSPYDTDLDRNAANYVPLTPLSFIARSAAVFRSEEHTSELQALMRISFAVFCLNKNKK